MGLGDMIVLLFQISVASFNHFQFYFPVTIYIWNGSIIKKNACGFVIIGVLIEYITYVKCLQQIKKKC